MLEARTQSEVKSQKARARSQNGGGRRDEGRSYMLEARVQSQVRSQKPKGKRQKPKRRRAEGRRQKLDARCQVSEVRRRMVRHGRRRKSETRRKKAECQDGNLWNRWNLWMVLFGPWRSWRPWRLVRRGIECPANLWNRWKEWGPGVRGFWGSSRNLPNHLRNLRDLRIAPLSGSNHLRHRRASACIGGSIRSGCGRRGRAVVQYRVQRWRDSLTGCNCGLESRGELS